MSITADAVSQQDRGRSVPTVADGQTIRKQIESLAGVSIEDSDPEQLRFIVSQTKQAGNTLFKEKKYKGMCRQELNQR
jgi:hypothetical protein